MNMYILNMKIKIFKKLMHILLGLSCPSNKYVIKCSQFLDTLIVKHQLAGINNKKNISTINVNSNTINSIHKEDNITRTVLFEKRKIAS